MKTDTTCQHSPTDTHSYIGGCDHLVQYHLLINRSHSCPCTSNNGEVPEAVQGSVPCSRMLQHNQQHPLYQPNHTAAFTWYAVYTSARRQMVENRSEREHNEAAWLGWCLENIAAQQERELHKLSPVPCQCSLAEREQAHLLRLLTNATPLLPHTHTCIFTLNTYKPRKTFCLIDSISH